MKGHLYNGIFPIKGNHFELELRGHDGDKLTVRVIIYEPNGDLRELKEQEVYVNPEFTPERLKRAIERNLELLDYETAVPVELLAVHPEFEPAAAGASTENIIFALYDQASLGEYGFEDRFHNMFHWPDVAKHAFYLAFADRLIDEDLATWFSQARMMDLEGLCHAFDAAEFETLREGIGELIYLVDPYEAEFFEELWDEDAWFDAFARATESDWRTVEEGFKAALDHELDFTYIDANRDVLTA